MSINKTIILFSFLFFVILTGCKKHKVTTTYIPEQLKEYMMFRKGSYWIYINEKTGTIDSCYITKGPDFYYPHSGGYPDDPIYEECNIDYGGNIIVNSRIYTDDVHLELKSGLSGLVCLRPDFNQPIYIYYNGNSYKFLQFYDSLMINNIIFKNVVNTQNLWLKIVIHDTIYDTATFTFFIAKTVGILKYRQQYKLTDTTWSLLRYHIVR